MRNVTAMSDYSEVKHGYSLLVKLLTNKSNRDAFVGALGECCPGEAEEAFKLVDSWWSDISLNTFIAPNSEHDATEDRHGRLSMWRAFRGQAARVAFVFTVPMSLLDLAVLNLNFSSVAYLTEMELKSLFDKVVENVRGNSAFLKTLAPATIRQSVFNMLATTVARLKHEGFKEEREWRLIYAPARWQSPFIDAVIEVVSGIPQTIYRIPLDETVAPLAPLDLNCLFDRLIIGPTQYPWPMYEAFVNALKAAGVPPPENGKVVVSQIPIRT